MFNFVRLIFRSSTTSRSRRFCGRWLYRIIRLSWFLGIVTILLAETMQLILLNCCSFFKKHTVVGVANLCESVLIWSKKLAHLSFAHLNFFCSSVSAHLFFASHHYLLICVFSWDNHFLQTDVWLLKNNPNFKYLANMFKVVE